MLVTLPPYALAPTTFRFAALASLAGRAPLGGAREVALAAYLAARLADDTRPEYALAQPIRAERASHARSWLSTLALPAAVRPALVALVDASAGDGTSVASSLRTLLAAAATFLDSRAATELRQLANALDQP